MPRNTPRYLQVRGGFRADQTGIQDGQTAVRPAGRLNFAKDCSGQKYRRPDDEAEVLSLRDAEWPRAVKDEKRRIVSPIRVLVGVFRRDARFPRG
ncbi:hypothetical protein D3C75_1035180 [compost metagenome]